MLKARGSVVRQTRSRTAKATPKRASAPAKSIEEAAATQEAGVSIPKRASAPAKAAEGRKSQAGVRSTDSCILLARSFAFVSGMLKDGVCV